MSQVLYQAKNNYIKALAIETILLIVLFLGLSVWQWKGAIAFSLGFLSILLPFIAFFCIVFCIVFCWQKQLSTKLTSFYLAEAVKFLFTILLVIAFFKWFEITNFLLFFSGFMVALILNNLLPFLFR